MLNLSGSRLVLELNASGFSLATSAISPRSISTIYSETLLYWT